MKNIKSISILRTFRLHRWKRNISFLIIISFLNMLASCYYYKVNTKLTPEGKDIIDLQTKNKFIIIHAGNQVWNLKNITIEENILTGTVSSFTSHQKYKTTVQGTPNRYKKKKHEEEVLDEVHIYITDYEKKDEGKISFSLSRVSKIEIYDPAIGATIESWVFSALGICSLASVTIFIIILLTKQSCPFIYVWDGKNYQFCGEIYSGSILPPLERNDYLPLIGLIEESGEYKLKISNKVHEIQYTNLTKLIVIDHPEGSKVLVDKYGTYQTAIDIKAPKTAINFQGNNILDQIVKEDSLSYFGDEVGKETDGFIMNFEHPQSIKSCKLFIRAKNTFWLDYVFERFHNLFGNSYNTWMDKQKTASESKLRGWSLNQNIPLSVYVEKNNKWVFVDYYHLSGPMAFKEDVLPIDLSGLDTDTLRIKLEYGSFFWDIDYIGIDYTKNLELKSFEIPLQNAENNKGENITDFLKEDDSVYYIQPEVGDEAVLTFSAPKTPSIKRSVFLHSKGYYEILNNPSGIADRQYLKEFEKPGRFSQFSTELLQSYEKIARNK